MLPFSACRYGEEENAERSAGRDMRNARETVERAVMQVNNKRTLELEKFRFMMFAFLNSKK